MATYMGRPITVIKTRSNLCRIKYKDPAGRISYWWIARDDLEISAEDVVSYADTYEVHILKGEWSLFFIGSLDQCREVAKRMKQPARIYDWITDRKESL